MCTILVIASHMVVDCLHVVCSDVVRWIIFDVFLLNIHDVLVLKLLIVEFNEIYVKGLLLGLYKGIKAFVSVY